MSNDGVLLTPREASETLAGMIAQLDDVIADYTARTAGEISTSKRNQILADMRVQRRALELGREALNKIDRMGVMIQ